MPCLPRRWAIDILQCPRRGLVAYLCVGSSVYINAWELWLRAIGLVGPIKGRVCWLALWSSQTYYGPCIWVQAILSPVLELSGELLSLTLLGDVDQLLGGLAPCGAMPAPNPPAPYLSLGKSCSICFPMGYGEIEAGPMVSGTGCKPSFCLLILCASTLFVNSHLLDKKQVTFGSRGLAWCTTRISGQHWKAAGVGLRPGFKSQCCSSGESHWWFF